MKKYLVSALGDYERKLKTKKTYIYAKDEEEAWKKAWNMFSDYKEVGVWEDKDYAKTK